MRIIIVAALAENRVIGKDNDLVWHLPKDLKHFKSLTLGHPMVMGRKTFESFGKPLPGRTNIIVTRDKNYKVEGCIVVHSLQEGIEKAKELDNDIYIAGGAEIYKQVLPRTDLMYLTHVKARPDGDTFFPEFPKEEWKETARESFEPDEKHLYGFDFVTWERVR